MKPKQIINNLGRKCRDKITGFEGTIVSASFDVNGCVQYLVTPGLDADGKYPAKLIVWDIDRVTVLNAIVMPHSFNLDKKSKKDKLKANKTTGSIEKPERPA